MPRKPRKAFGGQVYHVMNRGNCGMDIFAKGADYLTFMKIMEEGRQRTGMRILAYCLMQDHWHMVLWPRKDEDLTSFVQWVAGTHVRRWRARREMMGAGHLYQGRFKNFPVQRNENLYRVLGYVEGNPKRARKSKRAEGWQYSSLYAGDRPAESQVQMTPWPVPRPADWVETVNAAIEPEELKLLRMHVQRGRPLGSDAWMRQAVTTMGLESTVRERGRPRKVVVAQKAIVPKSSKKPLSDKPTAKKPAAKKAVSAKPASSKKPTSVKKPVTTKPVSKKLASVKRPVTKKPVSKKLKSSKK